MSFFDDAFTGNNITQCALNQSSLNGADCILSNSTTTNSSNNNSHISDATQGPDGHWLASEPAYHAAMFLVRVAFPVVVVLGTVGNSLVLVLLKRGAVSTGNLSFFLGVLAVMDTIFLYTSGAKTWVRAVWDVELLHLGNGSCQLGLFLNHVSMSLSAWLVVLVAWQRWYTLSRPFQRCCPVENRRCGHIALASLVLTLLLANSYVFVTAKLYVHPWGRKCSPRPEYKHLVLEIVPYLLMALYSGLPAVLLILLNALLARVLYDSRRALLPAAQATRSSGCSGAGRCGGVRQPGHVQARYHHVTGMLLALSASWLVLTTPHTIFKLVDSQRDEELSLEGEATMLLLHVLFFLLLYLNHSINFLLYCALIRGFRREARALFSSISQALARCCFHHSPKRSSHAGLSANKGDNNNQRILLHDRRAGVPGVNEGGGHVGERGTGSFVPLLENNGPGPGPQSGQHGNGFAHCGSYNNCLLVQPRCSQHNRRGNKFLAGQRCRAAENCGLVESSPNEGRLRCYLHDEVNNVYRPVHSNKYIP